MTEPRAQRTVAPAQLPTQSPAGGGTPIPPDAPLIELAYTTLRRQLEALTAARPRRPSAPTPREIHQLRVAARRLRVALKLFRRLLPSTEAARLRADLRWFASALGDVRDLDVYTENFKAYSQQMPPEQREELSGYELYLRRERADAREKLAAVFCAPRYSALFDETAAFLAQGPSDGALRRWRSLSVRDGVRHSVGGSANKVRRLGNRISPRSTPTQIHELRIQAKRLRYEAEFFTASYPALRTLSDAAKSLQELLGTHQDACTATARLRRYAAILRTTATGRPPLPPALAELRRTQLRLARSVRQSFAARWAELAPSIADAGRLVT